MLVKFAQFYDRISDLIGYISGGLMILMMINVFYDVINRYLFKSGSIALQEMEWHLFSVMFLLGITYALKEDGHVRVDLIYDTLSKKKQAIINIVGTVIFLIPFSLLIAFGSIDFVAESYNIGEISGDPGGLTRRWIIKAAIPFAFFLLSMSSIGFVIKNINQYLSADTPDVSVKEGQA